MKNIRTWKQKPPMGMPLDMSNGFTRGLMYFLPLWERAGNRAVDVVGRRVHSFLNNPPWVPGQAVPYFGLSCNVTGQRITSPLNAYDQSLLVWPLTIATGFYLIASVASTAIFSITGTPSFTATIEQAGTANNITWAFSNGGSSVFGTNVPISVGNNYVASLVVTSANSQLYLNGVLASTKVQAVSNPTFSSPVFQVGANGGIAGSIVYWAAAWNRVLTPSEHLSLYKNPWQIFKRSSIPLIQRLQSSGGIIAPARGIYFSGMSNSAMNFGSPIDLILG